MDTCLNKFFSNKTLLGEPTKLIEFLKETFRNTFLIFSKLIAKLKKMLKHRIFKSILIYNQFSTIFLSGEISKNNYQFILFHKLLTMKTFFAFFFPYQLKLSFARYLFPCAINFQERLKKKCTVFLRIYLKIL